MKIAMLGDIAMYGRYCITKNPSVIKEFEAVSSFLSEHDVVIGNLETPFADSEPAVGYKSAHIKSDPGNIDLLKSLGVTHVNMANNHIGDYGSGSYIKTIELLESANIGWFGTEGRQVRIDRDEKIALLGYCSYNTNPSRLSLSSGEALNLLEVDTVLGAMEGSRAAGYFPILSVHSGQEHVHMPSPHDIAFARGLAREFNYVYYGHHPHVIQGAEFFGNSPIFYSLGNFIFDDVYTPRDHDKPLIAMSEENKTGIIASVEIKNGRVVDWRVTPIYLGERILLGDEVVGFNLKKYSRALEQPFSKKYEEQRTGIIKEYIDSRRRMRDLRWYLNRLNINSIGIMVAARLNAKKYHSEFAGKLHKVGAGSEI